MQIKSLKIFCDVVARRSFSRAADENGISQSGASQVVHQLEQRLGVKLIDRSKRPFVLTPEGERYYGGCRKLVQRYHALEEEVRSPQKDVSGKVSVASIYSVGLSHMNDCVQHFLTQYPKANVRLQYQHPRRVYHLVESDQVDVGLISYPRSSRTITATSWRQEPMALVCSPRHLLAGRESITLPELDGINMVGYSDDLPIRREIDRNLVACHVSVKIVMEFDNVETIKRAIEIDAGVGLLPGPTAVREVAMGTLVAIPLAGDALVRPLGIIRRRGKELGKTARRFIQLLHERAQEDSQGLSDSAPSSAAELVGAAPRRKKVCVRAGRGFGRRGPGVIPVDTPRPSHVRRSALLRCDRSGTLVGRADKADIRTVHGIG